MDARMKVPALKEKALTFGENPRYLGILTERRSPAPDTRGPTFVLLNSGIVHRIGPHRNTVRLARELAQEGFRVFRFDLAGIGDSEARRDNLNFEEAALADIRYALDYLEKQIGAREFVVMGLCSGADNSFQAAVRDARIVGAVMLDGYAYRTTGFNLRYYGARAKRPGAWLRLGQRTFRRTLGYVEQRLARPVPAAHGDLHPSAPTAQYVRDFPPQAEVARQIRALSERGVHQYWVYSSGMQLYYNYRDQFRDAFRRIVSESSSRYLRYDFFAEANHTFTELTQQRALASAIVRWAKDCYSSEPPSMASHVPTNGSPAVPNA